MNAILGARKSSYATCNYISQLVYGDLGIEGRLASRSHAGGIALDPSHFKTTNKTSLAQAWEIHNACVKVSLI